MMNLIWHYAIHIASFLIGLLMVIGMSFWPLILIEKLIGIIRKRHKKNPKKPQS